MKIEKRKFKFLVLGGGGDYYNYAYAQLNTLKGVYFENRFPWNRFVERIFSLHFSKKINKIINLPFKKIWVHFVVARISRLIKDMADKYDNLCIVFFRAPVYTFLLEYGLGEKLKKKYPNLETVLFCQDLVATCDISIEIMKKHLDLVVSYDKRDADKYGLEYYNIPYSNLDRQIDLDNELEYDIYFTGAAKNRYEDIIEVYEKLKEAGLKCDFNIIGVPEEKQLYKEEINYCSEISYKENLEKASRAKCILEVIQKNSAGNTIRVDEAIMLDKLLLSNNVALSDNEWYDKKYMKIYSDITVEDIEFVKNANHIFYENKERLYPEKLLNFLEGKFNNL